jgi:hypothetical protein
MVTIIAFCKVPTVLTAPIFSWSHCCHHPNAFLTKEVMGSWSELESMQVAGKMTIFPGAVSSKGTSVIFTNLFTAEHFGGKGWDRRTDGRTDGRTDRQTLAIIYIDPPIQV